MAEVNADSINFRGISMTQSRGVRKGMIIDMESASRAIRASLNAAQKLSNVEIKEVYAGIADNHIKCTTNTGAVGIARGTVRQRDIDWVMETASSVYIPLNKEVMHIIPLEYIVDGEGQINNPLGMRGVRLETNVQIVTGSTNSLHNLIRCCEMAGVSVIDIVLEPLVSAMATLRDDEKECGCILVDIGGGTTDIALFRDSRFISTAILDLGGNQITNDISVCLAIPVQEAERIQKAYGMRSSGEYDPEEITVTAISGEKIISANLISDIIKSRSEELLNLIKSEIARLCGNYTPSFGVVFTGGVAQLKGFEMLAHSILNMPVRVGIPEGRDMIDMVRNPIYATAVGLILYAQKSMDDPSSMELLAGDLSHIRKWIKGLVGKLFSA
ncbi:cell division protein FtsA [Candidatus Magnetobacterium bavaricum]|uniref:Cell division protein FtsA n=1 Tax=Candidatus Magnetobacterium bavaricum TaxID=29290 RepID=A0A0F3GJE5_9BACT|nr:cell division protein FtsA [Candidatus Magnetobacterium bavaricum]